MNVVVIVAEFTTVRALCLSPPPGIATVALVVKFVPVNVTATDAPREPNDGLLTYRNFDCS